MVYRSSNNQGASIWTPQEWGSYDKDTRERTPQIYRNGHIVLIRIRSEPTLYQRQSPYKEPCTSLLKKPQLTETAISESISTPLPVSISLLKDSFKGKLGVSSGTPRALPLLQAGAWVSSRMHSCPRKSRLSYERKEPSTLRDLEGQ